MKFPESELAHKLLDGKKGIEIGASAHNPFNIIGCEYVDFTDDMETIPKKEEYRLCGKKQKVDKIAYAWNLLYADSSLDYVLSSHVIEHCWDVLKTIDEWLRVLKKGGLIYMIVPHKERTFDKDRPRTTYEELVNRTIGLYEEPDFDENKHFSVWITQDWAEICVREHLNLLYLIDEDTKAKNGFEVVIQK